MVVKSQIKFIKSLQQKKYRILNGMFVVEGVKMVQRVASDLPSNFRVYIRPPQSFCPQKVLIIK